MFICCLEKFPSNSNFTDDLHTHKSILQICHEYPNKTYLEPLPLASHYLTMLESKKSCIYLNIQPVAIIFNDAALKKEHKHPYVKFQIKEKTFKTAPAKKHQPLWSEVFRMRDFPGTTALLQVKNKHKLRSSDFIGETRFTSAKLLEGGHQKGVWLDLYDVNKCIGRIQLKLVAEGDYHLSQSVVTEEVNINNAAVTEVQEKEIIIDTKTFEADETQVRETIKEARQSTNTTEGKDTNTLEADETQVRETIKEARQSSNTTEGEVVEVVSDKVEARPMRREIIHIQPVIETLIRITPRITREVIIDKVMHETQVNEQNIHLQENLTMDKIVRGKEYVQGSVVEERIQEAPEYRELPTVYEEPVIVKEFIRERPVIYRDIHHQPLITREITHQIPIIEREVREKIQHETEYHKKDVEHRKIDLKAKPMITEVIHDQPEVHETFVKEKPLLKKEIIHEQEIVTREIHNKPVIQKDIYEERPIIQQELHEIPVEEVERVTKKPVYTEKVIKEEKERDISEFNVQKETLQTETSIALTKKSLCDKASS